ncbi:alpha-L-fucosidase [Herbiconiux flava]|uniref:alpha-L-fucosidase n=1 Tax=Herbiconiux flava TaxID=881268 RepID=A0A852STS9_9MICO|nr:alpha-L-fucosidase [Herbiconiux flava]NYD72143.1 alpha-L-fucosidase [Herbiconiux flava]GLK17894.1 alpha-L-fucosidase [Herbiconiux flava]
MSDGTTTAVRDSVTTSVLSRPLPAWARDATLGVFVHWGAYSVPAWAEPSGALGAVPDEEWFAHNAYAEWYANTIRIAGSPAAARHLEVHGGAPYAVFLDDWTAERYDPAEWARLFASIGADYVVPTTKHHDGIALWDAPGAGELSTVARGPRRDLIGPLAAAVREAGMRFGVYYSGGLDWAFAEHPPLTSSDDVSRLRPVGADYNDYAFAQVADLIDRYAPEVLWNDIDWPDAGKEPGPTSIEELLARFRAAAPEGIVNDRWGAPVGDYRTSEYDHDTGNETDTGWEHCRGLGFSFGYNAVEDEALTLTPRELARLYADVVSRGGRLLLNVGPTAAGEIPDAQRRTLDGVAPWLAEVKPATVGRSMAGRAGIRVTVPGASADRLDDPWWRAWRSPGGLVVVVDDPRAIVEADGPVRVFALPGGAEEETA